MGVLSKISEIRKAESIHREVRMTISDLWIDVGVMLRDLRRNKNLTQQQAAALIARDASVVLRWEKGCAVDATEVMDYLAKLETN